MMIEDANLFLSDCGKYIAMRTEPQQRGMGYDVLAVDGTGIWLSRRFDTKGIADDDPRMIYPEFEHMVTMYSNNGYDNRADRWVDDFVLRFCDMDVKKKFIWGTGNCVIKEYKARFRKPIKLLAWKYKTKRVK